MSTSSDNPGIALAEELRRLSEQDDSVTAMHAVPEAPRNSRLSDDQCCEDGLKISYLVENRLLRETLKYQCPIAELESKMSRETNVVPQNVEKR